MKNFNINNYHTLIFDFDGIFTDNKVYLSQSGEEIIRCVKADSLGFNLFNAFIRKYSLKINYFVLSKEKNEVIKLRLNKLKIKCFQGIDNKLDFIKRLDYKYGPKLWIHKNDLDFSKRLYYMKGPKIWIHKNELDVLKRLKYKYGSKIWIHNHELEYLK